MRRRGVTGPPGRVAAGRGEAPHQCESLSGGSAVEIGSHSNVKGCCYPAQSTPLPSLVSREFSRETMHDGMIETLERIVLSGRRGF